VLQHLKDRRQDETGFTLIELMVVVLIMGILMAIAIPTFLSTQGSANDASAKSNATNAFTGEKAYYEDNQVFIDAGSAAVSVTLDSQLPWVNAVGAATSQKVSAQVGAFAAAAFTEVAAGATGQGLLIEDLSKSGTCFYIADNEGVTSPAPPVIVYAESVGCFADTSIALPTAGNAGNAGAHIVASGGTIATTAWYSTW
jgi:prepilin-type N-terminal cleavage/methylation domain-containing protein